MQANLYTQFKCDGEIVNTRLHRHKTTRNKSDRGRGDAWKSENKGASRVQFALYPNRSALCLDDVTGYRQPQSGPPDSRDLALSTR